MRAIARYGSTSSLTKRSIPAFLCPGLEPGNLASLGRKRNASRRLQTQTRRLQLHTEPRTLKQDYVPVASLGLPKTCPGCGAFTQTVKTGDAGYYSISRKSVRAFVAQREGSIRRISEEARIFDHAVQKADPIILQSLGVAHGPVSYNEAMVEGAVNTPVCDRCHHLLHHHSGSSIVHPKLQSIQDIISESPYKYNHVYHVLDAADFPLSLIPQIQRHLSLMPQRSQNRRAKTGKFYHGRMAEMSFIITRSDLLAPRKEQVDGLMPYLVEVLRDALGSAGRDVRLGNVRCVSSKRGWWTKELKEAVWSRGGGGWLVGKVNVGKSNLFECIFPKGRNEDIRFEDTRQAASQALGSAISDDLVTSQDSTSPEIFHQHDGQQSGGWSGEHVKHLEESSLLPPAPAETAFPVMPIVSSLPGTTASPIRLSFGGGRGELIDLPGLSRGNLEDFVRDEHKPDLVMRHRIKPEEQLVLKPGQSLLISDLFRITPTNSDIILLACAFVPLKCQITSTEKATAIMSHERFSTVPQIAHPGVGGKLVSAGIYELRWDVTKQRAGPLTSSAAVDLKPQTLPFVIFSTDILVEGCGWIELAVQMRRRALESAGSEDGGIDGKTTFPAVEVFSPEGKFIGARRPMNAWVLGGQKPVPVSKRKVRPRRSMKGVKKAMKLAKRVQSAASSV